MSSNYFICFLGVLSFFFFISRCSVCALPGLPLLLSNARPPLFFLASPFLYFQMLSFPLLVSLGLSILLAVSLCNLGCRVVTASRACSPSFPPANPTRPMMLVRPVLRCEIPRTASGDVDLVALGLQDPDATDVPATSASPCLLYTSPSPRD